MSNKSRPENRDDTSIFVGSSNVFRDLHLPDAEELLAKAELALQIYRLIKNAGLNQTQAAKRLGTDRARVSNLMRGQLKEFSMERLFHFLNKLGQDVEVQIRPKRRKRAGVHFLAA